MKVGGLFPAEFDAVTSTWVIIWAQIECWLHQEFLMENPQRDCTGTASVSDLCKHIALG